MMSSNTRKKLKKFLGKTVMYTAFFGGVSSHSRNMVILFELRHNGKLISDHVSVSGEILKGNIDIGDKVSFFSEAYTYRDKRGVRKYGLKSVTYYIVGDNGEELFKKIRHDKANRQRRC